MTEWGVVEVIIALVGLFLTVGKPIMNLITSITKLTLSMDSIRSYVDQMVSKNTESHRDIFRQLDNHESRIGSLEGKVEIYDDRI